MDYAVEKGKNACLLPDQQPRSATHGSMLNRPAVCSGPALCAEMECAVELPFAHIEICRSLHGGDVPRKKSPGRIWQVCQSGIHTGLFHFHEFTYTQSGIRVS